MRQIRKSVFETNSSSTHSVSIRHNHNIIEKSYLNVSDDGYVHISMDEFGWEVNTYDSQTDRLSYLLTMLYMKCEDIQRKVNYSFGWGSSDESVKMTVQLISETAEFKQISESVAKRANCKGVILEPADGYIDHQSHENYSCLQDFLNDYGLDIEEFIFGSGVSVHTDNDNY